MKAILLCAGYATRLYPLTENQPKHLLKVGGKAIIDHVLDKIARVPSIDHTYIVTNDKFYSHFVSWAEGKENVTVFNDHTTSNEDRLGSVGDLQYAIEKSGVEDDIIIINADNLFEDDLNTVVDLFKEKQSSVVAFKDVGSLEIAKLMGVGALDDSGKVIEFVEKPAEPKSTFVSTGIYLIKKEDVPLIKECLDANTSGGELKSGEMVIYMMNRTPVYGCVFYKAWFDIGSHDQLKEADEHWSKL